MENLLNEILKLEAEIANLQIKKDELGINYLKNNFPFEKGDKIEIIKKNNEKEYGVILMIKFDSHSHMTGLANVFIKPMGRWGIIYHRRNAYWLDGDNVKEIKKFITPNNTKK